MNGEQVAIDRAVLADIERFLIRLSEHPQVVRAIEQKIDCGDFYGHVMDSLARLTKPPVLSPSSELLRTCMAALDAADEPCGCDVVQVCGRCRQIATARSLLTGGGIGPLEPRLRVRLRVSRKGTCGDVLAFVPAGVVGTVEEATPDGLTVAWDWALVCSIEPGQETGGLRRWWEEDRVPVEAVEFAGVEV